MAAGPGAGAEAVSRRLRPVPSPAPLFYQGHGKALQALGKTLQDKLEADAMKGWPIAPPPIDAWPRSIETVSSETPFFSSSTAKVSRNM
jgi:hypothetical protein